ncbi:hypothetical protein ABIF72_006279 [Bradyrhizobium japonicum]
MIIKVIERTCIFGQPATYYVADFPTRVEFPAR